MISDLIEKAESNLWPSSGGNSEYCSLRELGRLKVRGRAFDAMADIQCLGLSFVTGGRRVLAGAWKEFHGNDGICSRGAYCAGRGGPAAQVSRHRSSLQVLGWVWTRGRSARIDHIVHAMVRHGAGPPERGRRVCVSCHLTTSPAAWQHPRDLHSDMCSVTFSLPSSNKVDPLATPALWWNDSWSGGEKLALKHR